MNESILGCFVQIGFNPDLKEKDFMDLANTFRVYIWGESGIDKMIQLLKYKKYGNDLVFVLLQFNVKPTNEQLQKLKEIEGYRKKEKSIGVPIIIDDKNFFSKSESGRYDYLKEVIVQKLDLLEVVVKKKKLDTNMPLLKADLYNVLYAAQS